MAKLRISANLTLQLSPMSKVRDDKQGANCKAHERIKLFFFSQSYKIVVFEEYNCFIRILTILQCKVLHS